MSVPLRSVSPQPAQLSYPSKEGRRLRLSLSRRVELSFGFLDRLPDLFLPKEFGDPPNAAVGH